LIPVKPAKATRKTSTLPLYLDIVPHLDFPLAVGFTALSLSGFLSGPSSIAVIHCHVPFPVDLPGALATAFLG
jgi:hypothetical protein